MKVTLRVNQFPEEDQIMTLDTNLPIEEVCLAARKACRFTGSGEVTASWYTDRLHTKTINTIGH